MVVDRGPALEEDERVAAERLAARVAAEGIAREKAAEEAARAEMEALASSQSQAGLEASRKEAAAAAMKESTTAREAQNLAGGRAGDALQTYIQDKQRRQQPHSKLAQSAVAQYKQQEADKPKPARQTSFFVDGETGSRLPGQAGNMARADRTDRRPDPKQHATLS